MSEIVNFRILVMVLILTPNFLSSCKSDAKSLPDSAQVTAPIVKPKKVDYDTTKWTELTSEDGYIIDIKYATVDNFVKEVIYPCGRFFLRPDVAISLGKIRDELHAQGYKLKLFDGYRPRPAQQKLWDKVPNPDYVAPPSEGSMHNRGVAVDLTLTDLKGVELDMGTPYDFFGKEAHHDYTNLPQNVLIMRSKLKSVMESHGFLSIRTEWWHYSYAKGSYPLDDWQWPCLN